MEQYQLNTSSDKPEMTFERFMDRLFEIYNDCNQEVYYSEIFIPFFRMCAPPKTKIVPIYNERNFGPHTDNATKNFQRMKVISAPKENDKYVVPDFIYVPSEYSFDNPCKPYLMIETKAPVLHQGGHYYRNLRDYIDANYSELKAEIEACNHVIFTDGITWMFLEQNEQGHIVESEKYPTIKLVDEHKKYYKTDLITIKHNNNTVPFEWNNLKKQITALVLDKLSENTSH